MKKINYLFIALIITSCSTQQNENENLLPNIEIQFETGCESRESYSISIQTESGQLIAKKNEPNYYYGTKTDSIWTVNLDNTKINAVKNFILKAKILNGECPIESTSVDEYNITIENDTTYEIHGHCDWNGLDYFSIEKLLFKEHFNNLDYARNTLKDSVIKELKGQWIITGLNKELKRNDIVTMWRTDELDDLEKGMIIWNFSDSLSFGSLDNEIFDLTYSKKYQLLVAYGNVNLRISSGALVDSKGNMTIKNCGADFNIREIESEKIVLDYWWR